MLNAHDVLEAAKFADGIARSNYPVDIHNPSGTGTVIRARWTAPSSNRPSWATNVYRAIVSVLLLLDFA